MWRCHRWLSYLPLRPYHHHHPYQTQISEMQSNLTNSPLVAFAPYQKMENMLRELEKRCEKAGLPVDEILLGFGGMVSQSSFVFSSRLE
jgi:hypothetical protein